MFEKFAPSPRHFGSSLVVLRFKHFAAHRQALILQQRIRKFWLFNRLKAAATER